MIQAKFTREDGEEFTALADGFSIGSDAIMVALVQGSLLEVAARGLDGDRRWLVDKLWDFPSDTSALKHFDAVTFTEVGK